MFLFYVHSNVTATGNMTALEVIQNDDDVVEMYEKYFNCEETKKKYKCDVNDTYAEYSPIDGRCNNLENPFWGATLAKHNRFLESAYGDKYSNTYFLIHLLMLIGTFRSGTLLENFSVF